MTFKELQTIFRKTSWLTPKEENILLRDACIKFGTEKIPYKTFAEDLYDCRFELARSRIMDINIAHIEENLVAACLELDKEKTGLVRLQSLQRVLFEDKKLVLTPFQINVLLGYAKPNSAGLVEYAVFAKKCHHLID